jgi:glycosyltransferase involved in cell wall biosynthesis
MKVLFSAYACEPERGSEQEAGFQLLLAAAAVADEVVAVTRTNNLPSLRDRLPSNVQVVGHDLGATARRLKTLPGGTQAYYWAWQRTLTQLALRLHEVHRFDLVHHATFAVDWMPVGASIAGCPLVWGPVGGATGLPWHMWRHFRAAALAREAVRHFAASTLQYHYGRPAARSAALVVAQNFDEEALWRPYAGRIVVRPNVVVESFSESARPSGRQSDMRRAVFVGRLIPHKGCDWAIRAIALLPASDWSLDVVGDGREGNRLRRLAASLGLQERVRFHGWLPREDVLHVLRRADAMVAPSMYEGSGFAVAEAVALGCPVVGTRRGGIEVIVRDDEGILVDVSPRLHHALASALQTVGPRHTPTDDWSFASLERAVGQWYQEVTSR